MGDGCRFSGCLASCGGKRKWRVPVWFRAGHSHCTYLLHVSGLLAAVFWLPLIIVGTHNFSPNLDTIRKPKFRRLISFFSPISMQRFLASPVISKHRCRQKATFKDWQSIEKIPHRLLSSSFLCLSPQPAFLTQLRNMNQVPLDGTYGTSRHCHARCWLMSRMQGRQASSIALRMRLQSPADLEVHKLLYSSIAALRPSPLRTNSLR